MEKNTKIIFAIVGILLAFFLIFILVSVFIGSASLESGNIGLGDTIAVIPIYGEIAYGSSDSSYTNPDDIKSLIKEANDDSSISAIVLDVNSPGGTPVASEEIMQAIKNSKKPVVSWISDSGTSGAYLASSASDKIVASPSSWVGSIGVILQLSDLSEMYKKMGINKYSLKAGQYKDMGADYRNLTADEKKMLQTMVDEEYNYFISLVANNRNLTTDYVKSIAEGKIYTGRQALNIKLVDSLGGKDKAIQEAADLSGIGDSYNIITMSPPTTFEKILSGITSQLGYSMGAGIGDSNSSSKAQSSYF
ncbi:MAG: signal peptide peptidase SppA [Methanobacteriales archaeon HGW-Methanobacteriales-1]|jgi:protease-4|nr:MAG: signal peptide peptidase SppA [Methanobacteriales archaeon HGW-Methanobacteriales-1]